MISVLILKNAGRSRISEDLPIPGRPSLITTHWGSSPGSISPRTNWALFLKKLQKLIDSEKNQELLYTLKTYLENNLNYSPTAEKLFVNVNTVRRRIEKVNELIPVHWDDYVERTKLGLLLQYLQPGPDSIIHLKERRNGS